MKPLTADMGRPAAPVRCELDDCEFYVREHTALEDLEYTGGLAALPEDMGASERGLQVMVRRMHIHVCDAEGARVYREMTPEQMIEQLGARFIERVYDKMIDALAGMTSVEDAEKES